MLLHKELIPRILKPFYEKYRELCRVKEAWEQGKISEEHLRSWPLKVFIEPTNRCLMRCVYCARHAMDRPEGYMTLEVFESILKGLPTGIQICLTGNGEPLLYPQLPEMVRKAVDKGFIVSVITNAAALHKKMRKALLEAGVHRIQISIDTVFPEIFEKLTGNTVRFKVVWRNLLDFLYEARIKNNHQVFITISAVLVKEVKKDLPFLRWFWAKLPIDNFYEGPLLTLQTHSGRYNEISPCSDIPWRPCANPWFIAFVNWDGSVNICPQDFKNIWPVGTIKEDLLKVVNSERAQALRKALLIKDEDFFKACGYFCHSCNAWCPEVEHSIPDLVGGYLQLLSGLTLGEVVIQREYSSSKLEFLEFLHSNIENFTEILASLKLEFEREVQRNNENF